MLAHTLAACLSLLALAKVAPLPVAVPVEPPDRLVYVATNLAVDQNVDKLKALMTRSAALGATGIVLSDSKFSRLATLPKAYFEHCGQIKAHAASLKLEIIPCVFPVGYSNDLLSLDPNLAEGVPVVDARFTTRGDIATLRSDSTLTLPSLANLKAWSFHDDTVVQDGDAATTTDPKGRNARASHKLTVIPHRQYHVSVKVRTRDFRGEPEIKALAANPVKDGEPISLTFSSLDVAPTQDWREHHAVFNSLNFSEVRLYLGCWGGDTGTLSWKDLRIEEVGLLNVVRRAGAPLTVALETPSGQKPLLEGTDFEPIADPRMGHPSELWPGEYEVWHQPPTITLKKPLPENSTLRVSYHHAVTIHRGQVMICPSEPKTMELLKDQARRVHALWNAPAYWMQHDEIRCLNHDASCLARKLTPGAILADNLRACTQILRDVNPSGRIYVWSDMFDPTHNAVKGPYYLVNGDLTGAWEGLNRSVIVGAWNFGKRAESLRFFADRGNPVVLAGYYDDPNVASNLFAWLDAVPKNAPFRGVMYTTWRSEYKDLEFFMQAAKDHESR